MESFIAALYHLRGRYHWAEPAFQRRASQPKHQLSCSALKQSWLTQLQLREPKQSHSAQAAEAEAASLIHSPPVAEAEAAEAADAEDGAVGGRSSRSTGTTRYLVDKWDW